MSEGSRHGRTEDVTSAERRYLVVSADSHAGPTLEVQLRAYCPKKYIETYDDFCREVKALRHDELDEASLRRDQREIRRRLGKRADTSDLAAKAFERTRTCLGQNDPHVRLRDMDSDGIAADVIFAGGQNGEMLPFIGFGVDAGPPERAQELRAVGGHIWNLWLSDFVSVEPQRHVGVMQVPIWDVEAAVREVEWGREVGLKAVNFPAPRSDFPSYNEPVYEPFWRACESLGLPLLTHSSGGEPALGTHGPGGSALHMAEIHWLSRRAIWQLIFGGVFEDHPGLKLVVTESRVAWVPDMLRDLDSIYLDDLLEVIRRRLSKKPSEYWATNCFNSGSFLAPYEAAMRHDVGLRNLMWGSDYPHAEGTWPRTQAAMRHTFTGIPEDDVRMLLGLNALDVYPLDGDSLRKVANKIGPTPEDVDRPLLEDEWPEFRGHAFRERGAFS
jgi:predicted TIM-barrel fold metal-dependent hydrolase